MSLPATASSSLTPPSFSVNGKSLQLQLSRPLPQLPERKIYNPAYFFNETYQHEIANHYRDYKRRPRLPRRRRHTIYVPYRRAAFYGVVSGGRRPVLPIAVHDFPRFTAVYTTPRGRQTLCESAPPDDTYNATVRRIRQAKTCKELKVLVERQLRWSECAKSNATTNSSGRVSLVKRRQKSATGVVGLSSSRKADNWATVGERKCEKSAKQQTNNDTDVNVQIAVANANEKWCHCNDAADVGNANDNLKKVEANVLRVWLSKQQAQDKQQTYKQFKAAQAKSKALESVCQAVSATVHQVRPQTANYNLNKYQLSEEEHNFLNSTAYFLQLASNYYEQGFLRNINYLQAIGQRNAAARRGKLTTKRPNSYSSNDESANATATATATPTSSDTNTPRVRSAEHFFHLAFLLQRIGHKRSFKLDTTTNAATTTKSRYHNPCAIRVNIKPNVGQTPKAPRQPASAQCTAFKLDDCSMNDYLNANTPTTVNTTNTCTAEHNTSTANTVAARAHFHELIDHLMQLEISDIDASLPKITLTDCSTHCNVVDETAQPNDNAFAFEFDSTYNSNNFSGYNALQSQLDKQQVQQQQQLQQQQLQTTAHRSGFTLRETKFGAVGLNTSLELPDEVVYYSSEARPP